MTLQIPVRPDGPRDPAPTPIFGVPSGITKITRQLAQRNGWSDDQIAAHVRKVGTLYPDEMPAPPPESLPFYTPAQIATMTSADPRWIIDGFLASEAITEIDGKVKASGKTTLILDACRSIVLGDRFLGRQTAKTKIVYLTEQQRGPFLTALKRAKLDNCQDILVLFRADFHGYDWTEVVAAAVARCQEFGAEVLVIDTIAKLAGVLQENESGAWSQAMTPLQDAAHAGLAVLVARHARKGSGEVGETGRGSSAASGDVDIILDLRRPEGNDPSGRRRVLESLSRYEETPDKVVIELTEDGYRLLGDEEAVSKADATRFVLAALRARAANGESGLTQDELTDLGKQEAGAIGPMSIRRALNDLTTAFGNHQVIARGRGVRGDPKRYELAPATPENTFLSLERGYDRKESETRATPEADPPTPSTAALITSPAQ